MVLLSNSGPLFRALFPKHGYASETYGQLVKNKKLLISPEEFKSSKSWVQPEITASGNSDQYFGTISLSGTVLLCRC